MKPIINHVYKNNHNNKIYIITGIASYIPEVSDGDYKDNIDIVTYKDEDGIQFAMNISEFNNHFQLTNEIMNMSKPVHPNDKLQKDAITLYISSKIGSKLLDTKDIIAEGEHFDVRVDNVKTEISTGFFNRGTKYKIFVTGKQMDIEKFKRSLR